MPKHNNHRPFWICVWGQIGQGNHVIIVTSSLSWSSVFKRKIGFSNSSGLKNVFEKLRLRDVLVRTVGLSIEIKLRFVDGVWIPLKKPNAVLQAILLFIQNISCFSLVKTALIIHHNQLLFNKFGNNLLNIESMTSKVQPAADYWTVDRENLGKRLCYIWWSEKQSEMAKLL